MIRRATGNLLTSKTEALVNAVNCVGVMGKGIAHQFAKAFPENLAAYQLACSRGEVQPGLMFITEAAELTGPRWIINFPTKRHWRNPSRIDDIAAGLKALSDNVARLKIRSIAIPPLGCGLGGLRWSEVRPLIEAAFENAPDVDVLLYEPHEA